MVMGLIIEVHFGLAPAITFQSFQLLPAVLPTLATEIVNSTEWDLVSSFRKPPY